MVVTKHFATHGKKYRRRLIKYILNPDKTDNLKLVSDFGMSNYLDFPSYEEMVEMYNVNFTNNDKLYEYRNDRQEKHQQNIHAHHLIQSFSPEDNLTPEEINRIGYETIMELTGGRFRFIVATHTDKDHIHNHILINAIDCNSDKKLIWNYALERNLRMISDRISKMAGAKIIEKRFSYRDYQKYRATSHKFELKQRLYFLMQQSKSFDDFLEKAEQLHVHIDFSQKHSRFMMTDRAMTKPIRGRQLSKRDLYDEDFFRMHFAKQEIASRLEFLLNCVNSLEALLTKSKELNLTIDLKQKNVIFILEENGKQFSLSHKKISDEKLYDVNFFQDYFKNKEVGVSEGIENLQAQYRAFQEERDKEKVSTEEIEEAFETFKEKRDAVHEFEVKLTEHQIEKLVDEGIYIKVSFGINQSGLIFIPNYQLDIMEEENQKKYKVYIRETTSYFVYNKEHSDKNQYIKGRTLIRQLTNDSRVIPYRRPTVERLQEKISEISLLIELTETDKKYQDIKDNLVSEIAELDIKLTQTNEKIATLNKMAEVLIDSKSEGSGSQKLARHEFSKLNMTESTTLEQVNEELLKLQQEFGNVIDEYEKTIRKLGQLFKVFDECINKEIMNEI
ncbi:TPA: relaxase/mobilization nuclease domain-containing protein [Streptococcus pneumoniae]|uniref:SAG1250 family conjugative relaxase n=1 Tax=Streptococcus pneumoniae TaxID=1313 RepID=UPI000768E9A1|nr:SAG1250 family conjugative relaxase [Streptococcus pneumoniae]VLV04785.1 Tn5252, relaxase [Streptococcus pneumoniae]HET1808778.1 relaxase/mobilization nuclease domain-containing protein [Streptococcus pneumoniae]HEV9370868.1 relaxase/mobilization nuclease domain-containing protein [Streptococcus pneumoniae]HEV9921016.1 relaxase/mobilization nuclease domain-containing protein [Streptococcus pneumoniae]HEW0369903.1 relaxase/mobilization nuclease domain-containing protein [Streptococcus pneumo